MVTKLTSLLEKANKEMGSIIAEQEISNFSEKISLPLKWLENALEKRDVASAVQFQERVLELSGPFKMKYQNLPILTKVNDVVKRCQTELSDAIADAKVQKVEKQIRSLLDLKVKSLTFVDFFNLTFVDLFLRN